MFRTAAILVALVGLASANWELYKSAYGKSYGRVEETVRRRLFEENVAKINAHNLRHDLGLTTYRMGLNEFTDMTHEELDAFRGLKSSASDTVRTGHRFEHELITDDLPATVDWREQGYVTPVKNQHKCGSCWAFSVTGSVEGQHFKATGKLVSLSEQNLVDCSEENYGCEGGDVEKAITYIQTNGGIDTEELYPYTGKVGPCNFTSEAVGARVKGFVDLPQGDEKALQKAVATVGPISVRILATDNFQAYKGGIFDDPDCIPGYHNHAVLVVGYGTENGVDYWLVKNSWGTKWGEHGYIRMSRNKDNQCSIALKPSYPMV